MDSNKVEIAHLTAKNRKKAALSMCKTVLFLMAVTAMSDFLSLSFALLVEKFSPELVRGIAKVFVLFGSSRTEGYTAARLVLSSDSFSKIIGMVVTFFSLVVPAVFFAKIERVEPEKSFNVNGKLVKPFVPVFCLCHLFTTFASVFSGTINDFMLPESSEVYQSLTGVVSQKFNLYEFIVSVLCVAVFVPLVEEYVFRGVLFSYLSRYGLHFGIVASAVVFGIAHISPVQSVYAFVFGILSATLVAVTGNIKTSVIFHSLNNFLTVVLGYIMGAVSSEQFGLINCFYLMVASSLGIYGFYVLCRDGGIMSKLSKAADENDNPHIEKCGMKQIVVLPLVVYLAYYVYSVFKMVM